MFVQALLLAGMTANTGSVSVFTGESLNPGRTFPLWVQLSPAAGYHTYWENPGDAGSPTKVKWDLGPGWKVESYTWPVPERIESGGVVSYGYSAPAAILAQLKAPANLALGTKVHIKGKVDWLTCTPEACTPAKGDFDFPIEVTQQPIAEHNIRPLGDYPVPLQGWKATARRLGDKISLTLSGGKPIPAPKGTYFFCSDAQVISHGAAQAFQPTSGGLVGTFKTSEYSVKKPVRLRGMLVSPKGSTLDGNHRGLIFDIPME